MRKTLFFVALASLLAVSCGQNKKTASTVEVPEVTPLDSIEIKYAPVLGKGDVAPDFTANTPEGVAVNLSDFKGSYVVIDFWATWCPDCIDELPELKAIYNEFKDKKVAGKKVEFISMSFDHDGDAWKKFIVDNDMQWHQVSNLIKWKQNPISEQFQIKWIPTFCVVGPDGTIVGSSIKAFRIREILNAQN